jgi:hypothetical protein
VGAVAAVGVDDDLAAGEAASPIGPPMTNRPVGLMKYRVFSSRSSAGMVASTTSAISASRRSS